MFGAGAVGTYVGGSLALHGYPVVFLIRPKTAAELHRTGLRLALGARDFHLGDYHIEEPVTATSLDDALHLASFDVVILALKSYDTPAAIEAMLPFSDSLPAILSLQNGVENEPALARAFGASRVIAGTLTSAIARRGPGDIALERLRGGGIAGDHPLSTSLATAFNLSGLNTRIYANALEMKWSKLLANLLGNATSAILDMTPAKVFSDSRSFHIEVRQLREALAVMGAQGLKPVDLPGTPVRALAFAIQYLPAPLFRPLMARAIGGGRGGKMPSFHIDLHAGRGKTEVDYLNGAVARFGEQLGIPTPVNRILNETLQALARGDLPLDEYARQPGKLLERVRGKDSWG